MQKISKQTNDSHCDFNLCLLLREMLAAFCHVAMVKFSFGSFATIEKSDLSYTQYRVHSTQKRRIVYTIIQYIVCI